MRHRSPGKQNESRVDDLVGGEDVITRMGLLGGVMFFNIKKAVCFLRPLRVWQPTLQASLCVLHPVIPSWFHYKGPSRRNDSLPPPTTIPPPRDPNTSNKHSITEIFEYDPHLDFEHSEPFGAKFNFLFGEEHS